MFGKGILTLSLVLFATAPALPQNNPFDVSFGYAISETSGMTGHGWWAGGEGAITPLVGLVGEVSGHYSGESVTLSGMTASVDVSSYGFRAGPRLWIPLEDSSRITPFVDLMLGGYHSSASVSTSGGGLPPIGVTGSDSGVAFAGGGGIDLRIGENLSTRIRPEWGTGLTGFALYTGLVMHLGQ